MKRIQIFGYVFVVALGLGQVSTADEAGSLTNLGELPLMKMANTCAEVFEAGEQHRRRGRVVNALDSFAWVLVNLPYAPLTRELNARNAGSFVSTLALADQSDLAAFGNERAIPLLNRIVSDATLLLPLKKKAQDLMKTLLLAPKLK